jgi:MFS family permease
MGGEWASGATLVSETWAAEHRGKALALMQSAWAVGYALAAAVNYFIQPSFGWRAVFFVGILPAFLTIWVRRTVKEPEIWRQANMTRAPRSTLPMLFSNGLAPVTIALTIMNACTLFGWWSFNLWLPSFLQEPVSRGGVGLEILSSSTMIVVMQVGMWFGYITFGFVSDRIGRKRTYIAYLLSAAFLLLIYVSVRAPMMLLALGPFVAFCATGYFSGFGAVTAEIFPTMIRGTAQGFTYNVGRIVSAAAPFAVGTLAQTQGFGTALSISSLAFLAAAVTWIWIPETRGRALT